MALDAEFKKHLHSLMVEVYEQTVAEIEQHKRELLFRAQQTHNTAAPPIAYKDAALYGMVFCLNRTIKKYIEAVEIWGYLIDAAFEKDMINEFWHLTAGPSSLMFPPAINGSSHAQAVNRSYAMERQRLASRLVREGSNRLRELKMKSKTIRKPSQNEVDLNTLIGELEQLRKHLEQSALSASDYQRLALLSEAEELAKKHDGSKAMEILSKVGKSALKVAKEIGTDVAARVIAKSIGIEA